MTYNNIWIPKNWLALALVVVFNLLIVDDLLKLLKFYRVELKIFLLSIFYPPIKITILSFFLINTDKFRNQNDKFGD